MDPAPREIVESGCSRVVYTFPISHRFRAPFHHLLRARLARDGIAYDYVCAASENLGKGDTVSIEWAILTPLIHLKIAGRNLLWHKVGAAIRDADLVILQQQNNLLANYLVQITRRLTGRRVAFFGHGRNFQAANPNSLGERWKRFWATKVHWWFAYTEETARLLESYGFPRARITVFNNAIDTTAIARERAALDPARLAALRADLVQGSDNVGVYVGGIYAEKRIAFLLASARAIRAKVPDFHLLVIGAGPDAGLLEAAPEDWVHYIGPRFGMEKTELVALAKVWLMPGLVGLAVLDSFAYETPMVTCALPYHSPEFAYLENGVNGVVVKDAESVKAYAQAVVVLLGDERWRLRLVAGAAQARARYSVEAMAERFAEGVKAALL